MMKKPPIDFFRPMGYYVYQYQDPSTGEIYYIGKGVNDRCWNHVSEKGYNPEHLTIIAQHLTEEESLLLESYLINQNSPTDNKVSGHHEGRFIMSRFTGLFDQYLNDQREMFNELHAFISEYDVVRKYVGYSWSRQKSFLVESNAIDNLYCSIKLESQGSGDTISVIFKGNKSKAPVIKKIKERCEEFTILGEGSGQDPWVSFVVSDLEEAVSLWSDFVGAA
jgi:hypothetical protein